MDKTFTPGLGAGSGVSLPNNSFLPVGSISVVDQDDVTELRISAGSLAGDWFGLVNVSNTEINVTIQNSAFVFDVMGYWSQTLTVPKSTQVFIAIIYSEDTSTLVANIAPAMASPGQSGQYLDETNPIFVGTMRGPQIETTGDLTVGGTLGITTAPLVTVLTETPAANQLITSAQTDSKVSTKVAEAKAQILSEVNSDATIARKSYVDAAVSASAETEDFKISQAKSALQALIDGKAPIAAPVFTGIPEVTDTPILTKPTQLASKFYVDDRIAGDVAFSQSTMLAAIGANKTELSQQINTASAANQAIAQSAVTTANTAASDASAAVTTSGQAVSTANQASINASAALTASNSAVTTANAASATASTANTTANTANTTAGAAVTTANTAQSTATAAVTTANSASTLATSLQTSTATSYLHITSGTTVTLPALSVGPNTVINATATTINIPEGINRPVGTRLRLVNLAVVATVRVPANELIWDIATLGPGSTAFVTSARGSWEFTWTMFGTTGRWVLYRSTPLIL